MCRKIIKEKHEALHFNRLEIQRSDILKNKLGNLDTQCMNKETVETASESEFKRNMHRKCRVSTMSQVEGSSYSISFLHRASQSKHTGLYK